MRHRSREMGVAAALSSSTEPGIRPSGRGSGRGVFSHLATAERRRIIVASGDHAVHPEDCGPEVTAAMIDFIRAALPRASAAMRCAGRPRSTTAG